MTPACIIARIKRKLATLFNGGINRCSKSKDMIHCLSPPNVRFRSTFDTSKNYLFSHAFALFIGIIPIHINKTIALFDAFMDTDQIDRRPRTIANQFHS